LKENAVVQQEKGGKSLGGNRVGWNEGCEPRKSAPDRE